MECVQALLGFGAAVNEANVRCLGSTERRRGGCVCGALWELARKHAFASGWVRPDGTRWRLWAKGDCVHVILQFMGSISVMGCSRRVQCGGGARHDGVMFWCECRAAWQTNGATPLYFASGKGHVECVRALLGGGAAINQAAVGSTRSMARHRQGLFVGRVGACVHACVCSCFGALGWHTFLGLGER